MLLLIDNYDSFTYNLSALFSYFIDPKTIQVHRNDALSLQQIAALNPAAIVLSPGPGHPSAAGVSIPVVQTFSGKIPLLGVCLGHQAIACAFGGEVVHAQTVQHAKQSRVYHQQQGVFRDVSNPITVGRYHSLAVERASLPDSLRVTAETESGVIMAIEHKQHPTYGLQFHPESILTEQGKQLASRFLKML